MANLGSGSIAWLADGESHPGICIQRGLRDATESRLQTGGNASPLAVAAADRVLHGRSFQDQREEFGARVVVWNKTLDQ